MSTEANADQAIEKTTVLRSKRGMNLEASRMIVCRLANLQAEVTIAGVEIDCRGPASPKDLRRLASANIRGGSEVRVVATGPGAELAIGEITHLFKHEDLYENGSCKFGEQGPRGKASRYRDGGPQSTLLWQHGFGDYRRNIEEDILNGRFFRR